MGYSHHLRTVSHILFAYYMKESFPSHRRQVKDHIKYEAYKDCKHHEMTWQFVPADVMWCEVYMI